MPISRARKSHMESMSTKSKAMPKAKAAKALPKIKMTMPKVHSGKNLPKMKTGNEKNSSSVRRGVDLAKNLKKMLKA